MNINPLHMHCASIAADFQIYLYGYFKSKERRIFIGSRYLEDMITFCLN